MGCGCKGASALAMTWAHLSAERPANAVHWALTAATIYRDQWSTSDRMYSMYGGILADAVVTLYTALRRQATQSAKARLCRDRRLTTCSSARLVV